MKDLPYFKFYVNEWLTGDISVESFEVQGVFVNICSLYWSKEGDLSEDFVRKKFRGHEQIMKALLDAEVMAIDAGYLVVKFLDEQMSERQRRAKQNRINGKKGGRPPRTKLTPEAEKNPLGYTSVSENNPTQTNKEEKRREEKRVEDNTLVADAPNKKESTTRFIKPTPEEIQAYCDERKNGLIGQHIFDHYEANGWKRGKTPIKDWKACVRTWEQNRQNNGKTTAGAAKNSTAAEHHRVDQHDTFGY